jgi:hypothetical protein
MDNWICRDWAGGIDSVLRGFGVSLDLFLIQMVVAITFFFFIGMFIRAIFRPSTQAMGYAEGNLLIFGSIAAAVLFVKQVCG